MDVKKKLEEAIKQGRLEGEAMLFQIRQAMERAEQCVMNNQDVKRN